MTVFRALLKALPDAGSTLERNASNKERAQLQVVADDNELSALVQEAFTHYAASRFADALRLLNRALATKPDAADLTYARASILFGWGRFHEALAAYESARDKGLEHAELYMYLGRSYSMTGNVEYAEFCMRKAVELEPDSWLARFGLGAVLQAQRQLEPAMAQYRRAIELHADSFDCYTSLGNCALERNDLTDAEAYFRRAIALDDQRPEGWADLGVVSERQQRFDEAMNAYKIADQLDPKIPGGKLDSYYNIAIALAETGQIEEAIALCEANLAERPGVPGYHAYSLALLTVGRLVEGWNLHDFRWLKEPYLSLRPKLQHY